MNIPFKILCVLTILTALTDQINAASFTGSALPETESTTKHLVPRNSANALNFSQAFTITAKNADLFSVKASSIIESTGTPKNFIAGSSIDVSNIATANGATTRVHMRKFLSSMTNSRIPMPSGNHKKPSILGPGGTQQIAPAKPILGPGGTQQIVPTKPILGPGGTQQIVPTKPILGPGGTQQIVPTKPILGPGGTQQIVPAKPILGPGGTQQIVPTKPILGPGGTQQIAPAKPVSPKKPSKHKVIISDSDSDSSDSDHSTRKAPAPSPATGSPDSSSSSTKHKKYQPKKTPPTSGKVYRNTRRPTLSKGHGLNLVPNIESKTKNAFQDRDAKD